MSKAIESGLPKRRIEEAAASKQAKIDSTETVIVGVNKFKSNLQPSVEVRTIDNTAVRDEQIASIRRIRRERNADRVKESLTALRDAAKDPRKNLLPLAIECMRQRATVGEVSQALEDVFGRYQAPQFSTPGAYLAGRKDKDKMVAIQERTKRFEEIHGRRPRIFVVKLGQDGHDRGAKVIATGFADLGFDVDIGPMFQTPAEAAKQAIENDVHVVGISSQAAGHLTLVPEFIQALKSGGGDYIKVVVGGIIPPGDYDALSAAGVACIFGPGTPIPESADKVLQTLGV
jgi:methylmalonyl-CoA mutase